MAESTNPCQQCGACCASFRMSFYWSEATSLGLPEYLTEQVNGTYNRMAGTNQSSSHCNALRSQIGVAMACSAYAQRRSP